MHGQYWGSERREIKIVVSKRYQAGKKEMRSTIGIMVGFLFSVIMLLMPVFAVWGTIWWIDAIGITVVVLALAAFVVCGSSFVGQWTLTLEVDSASLRLRNWRGSRVLWWPEVTAWCAVELEEGERLICLKSVSAREPIAIDPDLLNGKQFARIYRDIEEHCGPPRPGAEVLGENDSEPFTDKRP
jgi:hypothetical protein